jgi:glutamyl-tRNA reductase
MRDRIVIGASYRTASVEALGRLTWAKDGLAERLPPLARALGVDELIYFGTCNRVELIARLRPEDDALLVRSKLTRSMSDSGATSAPEERTFRVWKGEAALEHLMTVACGLDSARVGDREIATQLRDAWMLARAAGTSGSLLDGVIAEALAAARDAARQPRTDAAGPGLAERAAARVLRRVADTRAAVALVGVSPMTRSGGRALARAGVPLVVVNRSTSSAQRFGAELGARPVEWESFWRGERPVGGLIVAVGALEPIADVAALLRLRSAAPGARLLVVDFGVPANIGADRASAAGVAYVGMGELIAEAASNRTEALGAAADVRSVVERHLDRAIRATATRMAGPLIGALRARFEVQLERDIAHLLQGELAGLDPTQQQALRSWSARVASRMAHVPLRGLRSLAEAGELQHVESCLEGMHRALSGATRAEPHGE